jgi:hypothetical protein
LGKDLDELGTETLELVLLDELVEIGAETFEYQTEVTLVYKRLDHPEDVPLVVAVPLSIELQSLERSEASDSTIGRQGQMLTRSRIATSILL